MGDATATLTQRRQGDREDGEAIEKIFSKRAGRDGFVEVAMGGGDHADVDGNLAMIADSPTRRIVRKPEPAPLGDGSTRSRSAGVSRSHSPTECSIQCR